MTLVSSGPISMGDINIELGRARTSQISLETAENGGYVVINQNSIAKPSSTNPATINEWRGYNHLSVSEPPNAPYIYGSLESTDTHLYWAVPLDNDFEYELWKNNELYITTTESSYLDRDTIYYYNSYKVRAKKASSNWSDFSNVVYFGDTIDPRFPTDPRFPIDAIDSIDVADSIN